jgi:hypothetical protein
MRQRTQSSRKALSLHTSQVLSLLSTPTSINKAGYNRKWPAIPMRSAGNMRVKRKYSTMHKTMAQATERGSKELIASMEHIHA